MFSVQRTRETGLRKKPRPDHSNSFPLPFIRLDKKKSRLVSLVQFSLFCLCEQSSREPIGKKVYFFWNKQRYLYVWFTCLGEISSSNEPVLISLTFKCQLCFLYCSDTCFSMCSCVNLIVHLYHPITFMPLCSINQCNMNLVSLVSIITSK